MSIVYAETHYEDTVIQLMEGLGYRHVYGPNVERDYSVPYMVDVLFASLQTLNPQLPVTAIEEAIKKIRHTEAGDSLVDQNRKFTDYLQNGVEVSYKEKTRTKNARVYLMDAQNVDKNSFIVANQWTISEHEEKRPDLVLFLNGLPIVVMELKSPTREEADASTAYLQLQHYKKVIPSLFKYNMACVISDLAVSKIGTITSHEDRFMAWKTKDGSYEKTHLARFDTFFEGIFERSRFLDILKHFVCFSVDGEKTFKVFPGYHQFFAVKKALVMAEKAAETNGKGGVFWHTQGSGKSLSMVFYAHGLREQMSMPTIVVLTDRNDLDDQLFKQFVRCSSFLREEPIQAKSREHLKSLLKERVANGIIFSTMQKFEEGEGPLSERTNIVVISDEAHRSQYGLAERVIVKDGEAHLHIGAARLVRQALPNAIYVGFTGTPVSLKDRDTREVFGDYIDIYDMTQAVEDGATRPVYYESRVMCLNLDETVVKQIDEAYDAMALHAEDAVIERSKNELAQMEAVLGADATIESLVNDILSHYDEHRAHLLTGKAMIVAYSRPIAMKIYQRILSLRPMWRDKVGVVMTLSNDDPPEWRDWLGPNAKAHNEAMAKDFKDDNSSLKIAIVVDMWLTGFDVPSLATMYVYKPMSGHNLMQAIARVNRVFRDKEGGLVVDYVGIASALKKAMTEYTSRDKDNYGDTNIYETALKRFNEQLQICRDLFHKFDYSSFFTGDNLARSLIITEGVDFLLGAAKPNQPDPEKPHTLFIKAALALRQALTLCASVVEKAERVEAAYMEAVRTVLVKTLSDGRPQQFTLKEINDRINELLKHSVKSEGVINLFTETTKPFSLFDPTFLDEISKMKTKNLAMELLKKLLADQIIRYRKTNLVKSKKFSEKLQELVNAYINGMLTNEQVIEELLKMAQEISQNKAEYEEAGLSEEEIAFYDALTKPEGIRDLYEHKELIAMTRELTRLLRANRTVDWMKKQSARAKMRILVKKLLKRYKYPPEDRQEAIDIVLEQCCLWADSGADEFIATGAEEKPLMRPMPLGNKVFLNTHRQEEEYDDEILYDVAAHQNATLDPRHLND